MRAVSLVKCNTHLLSGNRTADFTVTHATHTGMNDGYMLVESISTHPTCIDEIDSLYPSISGLTTLTERGLGESSLPPIT